MPKQKQNYKIIEERLPLDKIAQIGAEYYLIVGHRGDHQSMGIPYFRLFLEYSKAL